MIVAVICDVLGRENNGTTIAAYNLIRSLKAKGHTVRIVCPDADKAGQPGYYVVPQYNFGPLNNYLHKNAVVVAKADPAILEAAIADADIIHVMIPFSLGKAAALYAHRHHIPLTAGFHCQAENITSHLHLKDYALANRITYKALYNRVYKYCDCIHYPTQFICDTFESVVGPTPHRIISNGVNKAFTPGPCVRPKEWEGKYVVLFTGRYSREKSHYLLIDAVAKSRHKDRIQLVFAGTGPLKLWLQARALRKKIPAPVMKFFSRKELLNVVRSADLYVHPAEIEIEAIACLEAIACGKVPLIADSPRSATRYFALSERNLFKANDSSDLAEKLDWWLDHPEEIASCAADYLNYAGQFDFDRCMDRMEEMLLEVREEKRGEP